MNESNKYLWFGVILNNASKFSVYETRICWQLEEKQSKVEQVVGNVRFRGFLQRELLCIFLFDFVIIGNIVIARKYIPLMKCKCECTVCE